MYNFTNQCLLDMQCKEPSPAQYSYSPAGEGSYFYFLFFINLVKHIAIILFIRIRPCRQIIPSCSTGSLRIRCNDSDVFFYQVIPVLDALWISFSYQKYRKKLSKDILYSTEFSLMQKKSRILNSGFCRGATRI